MNQIKNLKKLSSLSYFTKNTLSQFVDVPANSLYANINRWLKKGEIKQLKKGLYVTASYFDRVVDKGVYCEFLANKLREPSYLSLEYILQKYGMMAEAVYGLTSITLKSKSGYQNDLGSFLYQNIKTSLFCGFIIKDIGAYSIREATKAKALFDFLYLRLQRVKNIDAAFLQSLRLNLDEVTQKEWKEFGAYCQMTGVVKFKKLPKLLKGVVCAN